MKKNTVIITGAANGIGRAIAGKAHAEGTDIIACDIDKAGLKRLSADIPGIRTFQLDITDHTQVVEFFNEVNHLRCNWLVNNAGIYPGKNILDYSVEDIQQVVGINCLGAVYFSQLFAKNILANNLQGAIVNISSISGQHGSSDAIYGLSKAAIIGFTKSTAINFAPAIRVNAVAPGLVETDILKKIPADRYRSLRSHEILEEHILPEDVAESVYFLLSDKARNITGMTLDINNGQYIR